MYELYLIRLELNVKNVIALALAHSRTPRLEIIPTPTGNLQVCSKSLSTNSGSIPTEDVKLSIIMYIINEGVIAQKKVFFNEFL